MPRTNIVEKLLPEPKEGEYLSMRNGLKVCWYTFATREQADEWAKVAKHNGNIQWARGYDFGYQSPGHITVTEAGYEVCFP